MSRPANHAGDVTFRLRTAVAEDRKAIKRLIRIVRINTFGIDWRRFVVAVGGKNTVIGSGRLKYHTGGSVELASIAVHGRWRGKGVGRALIEHLLRTTKRDLWLTCRSSMTAFYERFDFHEIHGVRDVPFHFRVVIRMSAVIRLSARTHEYIAVMYRPFVHTTDATP